MPSPRTGGAETRACQRENDRQSVAAVLPQSSHPEGSTCLGGGGGGGGGGGFNIQLTVLKNFSSKSLLAGP